MRGSFTGAVKDQPGLFTVSEGGTFFLDEVGEMAPATQVKLLRALQEREIIPVGGTKPIKINVRLIAATNADLEREVTEGRFRTDLFYRLNVIPLRLPSLRQRRDDIPLLAEHFLARFVAGGTPKSFSTEAMDALLRYDWPGNVRELENVAERAVILNEGGEIRLQDLPEKVIRGPSRTASLVIETPCMTLEELEREYILRVLNHTGWQKKRASEILGINPSTLYRKLLAYGIPERDAASGRRRRPMPPARPMPSRRKRRRDAFCTLPCRMGHPLAGCTARACRNQRGLLGCRARAQCNTRALYHELAHRVFLARHWRIKEIERRRRRTEM